MIRAEYRVAEDIHKRIWQEFRYDQEFERDLLEAHKGSFAAGINHYDDAQVWALYRTRHEAEACRHRLLNVFYKWAAKLPEELLK